MMENGKPLVSIICITYNHEKYIEQTIQGFLMQKTDFEYEILINDDASTDKTSEIVKRYSEEYPDKIKALLQKTNQCMGLGRKNHMPMMNLFNIARGEYLAFCEGDDFWNDDNKLQKQIDILCKNNDMSAVYHNVYIVDQNGNSTTHGAFGWKNEHYCNLEIYTENGKIEGHLSSLVCRNFWKNFDDKTQTEYDYSLANGDILLFIINCIKGKVLYLEDSMSTYRHITLQGTSWSARMKNKNRSLIEYNAVIAVKEFVQKSFSLNLCVNKALDKIVVNSLYFYLKTRSVEDRKILSELIKRNRMNLNIVSLTVKVFLQKVINKISHITKR